MPDATFCVIIPAHNEEAVIGRCLATLLKDAPRDNVPEIIVAANGCTDDTVRIARETAPSATVLDLEQGSKAIAMNEAGKLARSYPRIYLDADVECDYASLRALAKTLRETGAMAGSPALRLDLSHSSMWVQSYFRVWRTQPYVTRNMVGSGCYGISREGHEKIGEFPIITGDDIWVHSRFPEEKRVNISEDGNGNPVYFTVLPPRKLTSLIKIDTRRRLGTQEVKRLHPSPHYSGSNSPKDLFRALKHGANLFDILVYTGVKAMVRLRVELAKRRSDKIVWERDDTAREA